MGLPEEEGTTGSKEPEDGLLPLLGDLLFAGAILVMIYPCLRRTISRIDRQFCRQFWQITEVILILAALSFVLVLMIAQQTKVTYCSFVRPFVGDQPENEVYAGMMLKLLVCVLLVCNYFCASGLQRFVGQFFQNLQVLESRLLGRHASSRSAFRRRHGHADSPQETLSNNSNTNSQTPVPAETYSDIFSTISTTPELESESFENRLHTTGSPPRLYCDVGTMVRFPEYPRSMCTLQFCPDQVNQVLHSPRAASCAENSFYSHPQPPSSQNLLSPTTGSTGFCPVHQSIHQHIPVHTRSSHHHLNSRCDPVTLEEVTGSCRGESGMSSVQPNCCKSGTSMGCSRAASRCSASFLCNSTTSPNHGRQSNVQDSVCSEILRRCPGNLSPVQVRQQDSLVGRAVTHRSSSSAASSSYRCCEHVSSCSNNCISFRPTRPGSTTPVRRRSHQLPTMLKMTRSGKIYGYG